MIAIKQWFPVVLFIMLYKVVLTFESVNEILNCAHSNEKVLAIRPYSAVHFLIMITKNFFSQFILKETYEHAPNHHARR